MIGKRALELGFESTIGIIHDGDGQLKPLEDEEAQVYFAMTAPQEDQLRAIRQVPGSHRQGQPNDWRCRAGSRYLYICEDGLVHYCSQQRGYPAFRSPNTRRDDVKREFLTAKSCAPHCTIGCVHRISYIDHWRAPQTQTVLPPGNGGLVQTLSGSLKLAGLRAPDFQL